MPSSSTRRVAWWQASNSIWVFPHRAAEAVASTPLELRPRATRRGGAFRIRSLRGPAVTVAGPSLAITYLSLLVLLPVAAILSNAFTNGFDSFWRAVTQP